MEQTNHRSYHTSFGRELAEGLHRQGGQQSSKDTEGVIMGNAARPQPHGVSAPEIVAERDGRPNADCIDQLGVKIDRIRVSTENHALNSPVDGC